MTTSTPEPEQIQQPQATIKTVDDGPLQVKGSFQVVDHNGDAYEFPGRTAFLCRCGHSATKPFCDGSHKREGFTANGRASDRGTT